MQLTAVVEGHVQGVGFRWWVHSVLADLGLRGSAQNMPDGTVRVRATGPEPALRVLVSTLRGGRAPGRVDRATITWEPDD